MEHSYESLGEISPAVLDMSFMLRYFDLSGSLMVHLLHHQIPSGAVSNFPSSLLAYAQQYPSKSLASVSCM